MFIGYVWLCMSILYFIFTLFLHANIFKLAVMMDWFTFNWTECTLTISISLLVSLSMISCSTSCTALLFLLLQTIQKWPVLLHSVHTLPYARHCLGWWKLPQYLYACCAGLHGCAWVFEFYGLFWIPLFCKTLFALLYCSLHLPEPFVPLLFSPMLEHCHLWCGHDFLTPLILCLFPLTCLYHWVHG